MLLGKTRTRTSGALTFRLRAKLYQPTGVLHARDRHIHQITWFVQVAWGSSTRPTNLQRTSKQQPLERPKYRCPLALSDPLGNLLEDIPSIFPPYSWADEGAPTAVVGRPAHVGRTQCAEHHDMHELVRTLPCCRSGLQC